LCLLQGGGFCGSRTKPLNLDLSGYDGLELRVKGDGQIFKFNIKTVSAQHQNSEYTTSKWVRILQGKRLWAHAPYQHAHPVKLCCNCAFDGKGKRGWQ